MDVVQKIGRLFSTTRPRVAIRAIVPRESHVDAAAGHRSSHSQRSRDSRRAGPRTGILAAGYDADVITLDADPLDDVSILGNPKHVVGVWKEGVQVRNSREA